MNGATSIMSLFDKLVHDFGLTAWSPKDWQALSAKTIHKMAKAAPKGWWRDTILLYLSREISTQTQKNIIEHVRPLPEWLLHGDHCDDYLGHIPRNIRDIIYEYLITTCIVTSNSGYTTRDVYFCGLKHSWDDAPSSTAYGPTEKIYWWHILGRRTRIDGRPDVICIHPDREVIMWNGDYLRTMARSRESSPFHGENEVTMGDGSEIDQLIAKHVAELERYD